MTRMTTITAVAICAFVTTSPDSLQAEIVYSDNATHTFSTAGLPSLRATNSTTLDVLSGAGINTSYAESEGLHFQNTSIGNVSGGIINGANHAIEADGNSVVSVSGGSMSSHFQGIATLDSAVANVSGGTIYADGIGLGLKLYGGTANVSGGQVTGTWNGVEMNGTSRLNLYGGTILGQAFHGITVRESSTAYVYGGSLTGGTNELDVRDSAMIYVYGHNFNLPYGPIASTSGTLTGTLASGLAVTYRYDQEFASGLANHIVLVNMVPEPSSIVTAFLGFVALTVLAGKRIWRTGR